MLNHDERTALARGIASVLAGVLCFGAIWLVAGWYGVGAVAITCYVACLPDMCRRPRWWWS